MSPSIKLALCSRINFGKQEQIELGNSQVVSSTESATTLATYQNLLLPFLHELLALLLGGNSDCFKNEARGQVGGLGSHGDRFS